MFIAIVVTAVVCTLGGGYGGFKWGASVEKKTASQLQALANSAVKKLG